MSSFIVLEHDLYPQTVDLAIGYTLPAAMNFNPHLTVGPLPRFCIPFTYLLFFKFHLRWTLSATAVISQPQTCIARPTRTQASPIQTARAVIRLFQAGRVASLLRATGASPVRTWMEYQWQSLLLLCLPHLAPYYCRKK